MNLFALDEEVASIEGKLAAAPVPARLPLLVQLAWHLRQRDSERALVLATQAEALAASLPDEVAGAALARLALVRVDVAALFCEFPRAESLLADAKMQFIALGDAEVAMHGSAMPCWPWPWAMASAKARHARAPPPAI